MNKIIIYSLIIEICTKNNFKLLKFFIMDEMKNNLSRNKFYLTIFMVNKNENKRKLYYFLESYIKNNYQKIINHYLK
jgi:hypothetical protein